MKIEYLFFLTRRDVSVSIDGQLRKDFDFFSYRSYIRVADYSASGKRDTWDIPWQYSILKSGGLGIIPRDNMIRNIGLGREDATHTTGSDNIDFTFGRPDRAECGIKRPVKPDRVYEKAYLARNWGIKKEMKYIQYKAGRVIPKAMEILKDRFGG